ncbi:hypothetical protein ANCDUO_02203 [Ancylostoma duodenale]|uniref:Uncharacterized protein n=1 Tax=Ancylostoma duodenale TaxID=51022 RepID=A0A0C2DC99_9BILA|nr:hypothetical protein ANCDUO_02203 [Ancylostoma duodenale]
MSEEQKIVQETVEEEQAPALPTTEPPKEDVGKPVTEAPKAEEKPAEEAPKEEKPASRIFKRPTLKWGKKRDEPAAPREPEQAKDIREDALGWIAQQIPPAVHKPGAVHVEPEAAVVEAAPVTESTPAAEAEKAAEAPAEPEASKDAEEKKDEPAAEPAKPEEKPAPAQKTQKEKQAELVGKFASWAKESLGLEEGKVKLFML